MKLLEHVEEQISLEFAVEDTGIGIPKDKMNRLFESYSQVDTSTTRTHGGTGLGLTISQRLVNLMGGQIQVESVLGEGSKFFFKLNMITEEETDKPWEIKLKKPNNEFKVLLIESHDKTRKVTSELLDCWNITHFSAESCDKGFELIIKHEFDLVLIDFYLPGMNGVAVAEKLKEELKGKTARDYPAFTQQVHH